MRDYGSFGRWLRQQREARGWLPIDLAARCPGFSDLSILRMEEGHAYPSCEDLPRICRAFGVRLPWDTGEPEAQTEDAAAAAFKKEPSARWHLEQAAEHPASSIAHASYMQEALRGLVEAMERLQAPDVAEARKRRQEAVEGLLESADEYRQMSGGRSAALGNVIAAIRELNR